MVPFLKVANRLLIAPVLNEDGIAVEAEQEACEKLSEARFLEFSPAVISQKLIVRRWEEYLASQSASQTATKITADEAHGAA